MVFKPGQSGNPKGKPPGIRHTAWAEQFKKCFTPRQYATVLKKLKEAIAKGDQWAIKLVLDKTLPDLAQVEADVRETITSEDFRSWLWQGDLAATPASFRLPDAGPPAISGEPLLAPPDGPDME